MKNFELKNYLSTKINKKKKTQNVTAAEQESSYEDQIRVKDDKIVYNESQMFAKKPKFESKPIIIDEDVIVTCSTFSKRLKPLRWSKENTEIFYKALKMVGTDFTMIGNVFKLDRKQVKNKYLRELKINKERVDNVLGGDRIFDKIKWDEMVKSRKKF
ncbi:hypothetical protein COBT_000801 [Conglomerata obtusa]